ncbi:TIGR03564 family F420-dependent LLM class oxidoreductase [Actinophytocola xanthii]|uniref:LLM class F420-dependent oxidoreductase n=1 Tax=Actinophytocola xanthii TaxID=1912961 RepID=A0A1Q8CY50_9PSEU|nr:TIGR03564 family F420-dependent LLM class oxidoreductase [Actinophytocola xanthii]OLF19286.1 LLM class F420-dependent oxidoreductase [Actinophytocola xanthii]
MSIGVVVPVGTGNAVDSAVAYARQAAEAGVASAWFGQRFDVDSVALAGFVGREVPGLAVGTSVVPVYGRHPLTVAGAAQTTQAATGGRFTLGLGLGARAFVEPVFGEPHDRPVLRLREFLTVLRAVVETGTAEVVGETLVARTPMSAAVPGGSPLSVVVAAMGPQALRVAGELADGTLPFLAGPRALANHIVPAITRAADRAGRPAPRIVAAVPGVVTADVDAARATAVASTAFYDQIPSYQRTVSLSGVERAADLVVLGDEQTVADELVRYFDAGATEVVLTQTDLTTDEDRLRTWRLLGELRRTISLPQINSFVE